MSALLVRSFLSPLKLAPNSYSKVHVLLSPSFGSSGSKGSLEDDVAAAASSSSSSSPSSPFLPLSSLPSLVEQCPSLHSGSFKPSPQLPSGHLQTVYSTLADTVEEDAVHYTRRVLLLPDGGVLSLDICDPVDTKKDGGDDDDDATRPTIVIAHGLTGGSQESYVRHCVKRFAQPLQADQVAYRCVVVNFRGCANTPVTSRQLYSASKTSDVRSAVLFLRTLYPHSPLVGLGFSLGANVMAKYLGEEGDQTPLLGGIVCAAPFDLKKGSDLMEENTFRRHVYSRAMNTNLTRLAARHASSLALDEELQDALDILLDDEQGQAHVDRRGELAGSSKKTLKFCDDVFVRLVGGHRAPYGEFPFDSADSYYHHGGALNVLQGLQRPLLALNADDDPIVAAGSVQGLRSLMGYEVDGEASKANGQTEFIVLATTQGGGHLGWWQGIRKPSRWLATPVEQFAHALVQESRKKRQQQQQQQKGSLTDIPQRATTARRVVIELMPAHFLPSYETPQERRSRKADSSSNKETASNGSNLHADPPSSQRGARLPWLRTHVLTETEAPLHPSMARQGWQGGAPKDEPEFSVDGEGRIVGGGASGGGGEERAKGWCAYETTMIVDAQRPEVGYVELPAWTRVGGAGEQFQGGKQLAGTYANDVETTSDGKTLIAGL